MSFGKAHFMTQPKKEAPALKCEENEPRPNLVKNNGKVLNDLKTMSSVLVHQRLNMPKQQQRSSQVPTLVVKGTFFKGSTLLRPEDYYLIISSRLF